MSQVILAQQASSPGTPSATKAGLYISNETNPKEKLVNPAGGILTPTYGVFNTSTGDQTLTTGADTYVTGSTIAIPAGITFQAGAQLRWVIGVSKTGVSTAAPVFHVRCGTAATVSDTDLLNATGLAQTAVIDQGVIEINLLVRNASSTGNANTSISFTHNLATTGLQAQTSWGTTITSASFNFTTAGLIFGVSINPAGTAVWTVLSCSSKMIDFA